MEDKKQPIGELFETISYFSPTDISNLIDNLNEEQSVYMIGLAINMCYQKNLFTLEESEIISKSLRILNENRLSK
jgi:predicted amino acid racemase